MITRSTLNALCAGLLLALPLRVPGEDPALEPLPEPPPVPEAMSLEESLEPQVRIVRSGDKVITQYVVNGARARHQGRAPGQPAPSLLPHRHRWRRPPGPAQRLPGRGGPADRALGGAELVARAARRAEAFPPGAPGRQPVGGDGPLLLRFPPGGPRRQNPRTALLPAASLLPRSPRHPGHLGPQRPVRRRERGARRRDRDARARPGSSRASLRERSSRGARPWPSGVRHWFSSPSSASRRARFAVRRMRCASLRLFAAWVSTIACLISSSALGWTLNSLRPMPRSRRV